MNSISSLPKLSGDRVIVRVDYNVPLKGNKILDTHRIESSYDTIRFILKKGGTPILITHLADPTASVRPIASYLSKTFKIVHITHSVLDPEIFSLFAQVPKGTVILLENIRQYPEEEMCAPSFSKALAKLGSYYVNDAFSVSHRKHASVVGVARYIPAFAGLQLMREIQALHPVENKSTHPFIFILGGAKFSTKIPLLKRFISDADYVVVAGALLNSFYKTIGFEIGDSVVENGYEKQIRTLIKQPNLLIPVDVIVLRGLKKIVCTPDDIQSHDVIVDIGPQSIALLTQKISKAKRVVWNGPLGWYEKGFTKATVAVAEAIKESKTKAIVGGGDTVAVVQKILKEPQKRIFLSTGGGATIEFLSKGTLPGIVALK